MKKENIVKIYTCTLFVMLQFIFSAARCQDDLNTISGTFSNYTQNTIEEKLFVNTDKQFYVTGEIMWFKLYDVDASKHTPLELSKVAYVEITDSANKPMMQAKIALIDAEGKGSFYLPATLNSGNYKLRAYSNWMKNFSAGYFFEKNITIINVQKRLILPALQAEPKFDIQFFPEGGNLVNNIVSKVAFKAIDQYGKGIDFKGYLLDNADTSITFNPQHAGMGSFSLKPLPGHTYKAIIRIGNQTIIKNLPRAYNSGYVMNLSEAGDKIKVNIQSDNLSQQSIYLFAHTRQLVKIAKSSFLQNGNAVFLFDKALLGDGISHITIFNDHRQPVCERLYFKKPSTPLNINLHTGQTYGTRQKASLRIETGNDKIKNDSISLSLAVVLLDSLQSHDEAAIDSYLLLTSDLKGYIENPGYYFFDNRAETNTALDNLMLTSGWSRFKWEDIFRNAKQYFNYVPEYNGQLILGNVINSKTGSPAKGIETYFSIPRFQNAFTTSFSDEQGNIKFELKNFYGSSEIILQGKTNADSLYTINILDPFSKKFSGKPFPLFTFSDERVSTLRERSIDMQVQNIYAGKNLKRFKTPVFDTTAFYITPDAKYKLDDYTRFTTIEEVLREYIKLVDVRKREGDFHLLAFDFSNNEMFKSDPLVILDGVPVFDLDKFMALSALKLNTVEVVNRRYFLGGSIFNGILNWTSYKGDMADYDLSSHATIIDYAGLQQEREFYSSVYANETQVANHTPDFRNVLLWAPDIKIAGNETKDIEFYTSDLPGKYEIIIQGISRSGLTGTSSSTFSVNPVIK